MNNVGRHLRALSPPGCLSFRVLLFIIATEELIFYMRLLSPKIMFFSFGEGTFLTMLGLCWLQVTQFKLSKKRKSLVFWACHRGHQGIQGRKSSWAVQGEPRNQMLSSVPPALSGVPPMHILSLSLSSGTGFGNWVSFHSLCGEGGAWLHHLPCFVSWDSDSQRKADS